MSRSTDLLTSFLIGAAAGTAIAMMLAPSSGHETRRKLRDFTTDGYLRALNSAERTMSSMADRTRRVSEGARKMRESGRETVRAAKEAVAQGKAAYREESRKQA